MLRPIGGCHVFRVLLVCLFVALTSFPARADVATGTEAFRRGDYAVAMAAWHPLAKKGDAAAQYNLGILYRRGLGVPPDRLAALRWYRRAAKVDKADDAFRPARSRSKYRLVNILLEGGSVNRPAGIYWMQHSAKNGYGEAQFQLGLTYATGRDLPRDEAKDVSWYKKGAEQDVVVAQINLGSLYAQGRGVARDHIAALKCYKKAAQSDTSAAHYTLVRCTKIALVLRVNGRLISGTPLRAGQDTGKRFCAWSCSRGKLARPRRRR